MTYVPGTIPVYTGAGSPWATQNYGPLTNYVNSVSGVGTTVAPVVFPSDLGIYNGPIYSGGYYTTYGGGYVPYIGGYNTYSSGYTTYAGGYTTYAGSSYVPYNPVSPSYSYPAIVSSYQGSPSAYYSPPTTSSTGHYPSIIY